MPSLAHKYAVGDKFRIDTYDDNDGRFDEVVITRLLPLSDPQYEVALVDDPDDVLELHESYFDEGIAKFGKP